MNVAPGRALTLHSRGAGQKRPAPQFNVRANKDAGMNTTINLIDFAGQLHCISVNSKPERCPKCDDYKSVEVLGAVLTGREYDSRRDAIAVCQCSSILCSKTFTAFYAIIMENGVETGRLLRNSPLEYSAPPRFSETIESLSPTFCATYNQAANAEENGLMEICGAGYRRSLEFLCKDYAKFRIGGIDQKALNNVIRSTLGQCIKDNLPESIRDAANRAAWLGNDETHYYRVWTEHDLQDLKALIQLTAKSIDFAMELDHYISNMPGPKR